MNFASRRKDWRIKMSAETLAMDRPPAGGPDAFRRQGYVVVPNLIEPALVEFFWSYVHTKFASLLLTAGDPQVPNTPNGYGDPAFDGLLEYLRQKIEAHSGLALHPTYSYFRLYKRGDVLKRHRYSRLRNQHLIEYGTDAGRPMADFTSNAPPAPTARC